MVTKLTAYDSLLLKYKPRPIRNDREHRRVLRQVDELIGRHGPTPPRAEGELIAVLSTLIESYEVETTPRRKPTPAESLEHLIESKQVTRAQSRAGHGHSPLDDHKREGIASSLSARYM